MVARIGPKNPEKMRVLLKEWREYSNLTQERVAERIGTTKGTVSRMEVKTREPNLGYLAAFAEAIDRNVGDLFRDPNRPAQDELPPLTSVPLVSWVSAGEMTEQISVTDLDDFPVQYAAGLPPGEWIALRVDGPSMNKISPPDSIIYVNLADRALVPNRPYVIADETGQATYKRYRPNETPQFQPASYKKIEAPELVGAIRVVGRVYRSVIDM